MIARRTSTQSDIGQGKSDQSAEFFNLKLGSFLIPYSFQVAHNDLAVHCSGVIGTEFLKKYNLNLNFITINKVPIILDLATNCNK